MGSNKEEKKRLKAQAKLEKKKVKTRKTLLELGVSEQSESLTDEEPKVPWYKNPDWIRAIVGIASVIVALIAIIITLYY